jgi:hypothetical protein
MGSDTYHMYMHIIISDLLAPGRPIRALASDGSWAGPHDSNEGSLPAVDRVARRSKCCEQLLWCCEELFRCCEPSSLQHSTNDVASMLRTYSEHVANEVTCNIQHRASFFPLPACCDYVATMLRPVLRATSNIRSPPSPPWHSTPTLHVCNIETQHPQHLLNHSETLRCICRNMLE